jgi:carboxylesterase
VGRRVVIKRSDYSLQGGRAGVLLIHGLTGTPAEMRFVAKGLNARGYTVLGMQLAGHCGDEADLLATGWRDWYRSVEEAADQLRTQVDHLFAGGLSMGALLALRLAAQRPDWVQGLALYGTTFRYDGWTIPPIGRLSFLLPLVCRLGFGRGRVFHERPPYGIMDERIRARIVNAMLAGNSAAAGLPGNPWPSLAEFHRLAHHVRRQLGDVRAPCLAVHAANDDVSNATNVDIVRRGVRAPLRTVLLANSFHMITVDQERDRVVELSAGFFDEIVNSPSRWIADTLASP